MRWNPAWDKFILTTCLHTDKILLRSCKSEPAVQANAMSKV